MILRGNVFSKVLDMDTGITIVVPDNFEENKKYKTAYLLHGLCGNNNNWVDNSMLPVYARDYNTIFIMPEAARSFYLDMKNGERYYTYITEELPKICKSVFNISSAREDTAIIGASMGGFGALKCALSKPAQYGYCCAFSSACLYMNENVSLYRGKEDEFEKVFGTQMLKDFKGILGENLDIDYSNDLVKVASEISDEIKPKIYMCCGDKDFFIYDNKRFAKDIEELDFDCTFVEIDGEHNFYFFNEALKIALEFLYKEN